MNIFEPRETLFPQEYPELLKYVDAINQSYWLASKWNFQADINDFKYKLSDHEKKVIKRCLLCISTVEVKVKSFWSDLFKHLPKPEVNSVGITFSESEVRHADSYSKLLEKLGLYEDFGKVLLIPEIKGRLDYLSKYLKDSNSRDNKKYTRSLALFSLFVENVSLFSQFLVVKCFNQYRNVFKDIDNVIIDSSKEENLHAMLGAHLVDIIRKENPEWFDDEFYEDIRKACMKAYKAESAIIRWIFDHNDLDFVTIQEVDEYIKDRFNLSLRMIGMEDMFEVDKGMVEKFDFFEVEQSVTVHVDFFNRKNPNYSKYLTSYSEDDLF